MVVFWSRLGETEKLALAAALGAVQGRANIRLRWLREEVTPERIAAVPGWKEHRERMEKEYIAPRAIDLEWATGVVLATPGRESSEAPLWESFFGLGPCTGKQCGVIGELARQASRAGFSLEVHEPDPNANGARLLGRRVADSCN
jgi:hypothetical protein